MSEEKELSEFGKGFISCLVNFAGHFGVEWPFHRKEPDEKELEIWGSKEGWASHNIEMWANGATDHLYEIECPAGEQWNTVREKVKILKDKGLRMGHGFTGERWTKEDMYELFNLAREISVEADTILGVDSDSGKYT